MTGAELLQIARNGRPSVEYALNHKQTIIAARIDNRWQAVAMLTLLGSWASVTHDVLVNGKPCYDQSDFN